MVAEGMYTVYTVPPLGSSGFDPFCYSNVSCENNLMQSVQFLFTESPFIVRELLLCTVRCTLCTPRPVLCTRTHNGPCSRQYIPLSTSSDISSRYQVRFKIIGLIVLQRWKEMCSSQQCGRRQCSSGQCVGRGCAQFLTVFGRRQRCSGQCVGGVSAVLDTVQQCVEGRFQFLTVYGRSQCTYERRHCISGQFVRGGSTVPKSGLCTVTSLRF